MNIKRSLTRSALIQTRRPQLPPQGSCGSHYSPKRRWAPAQALKTSSALASSCATGLLHMVTPPQASDGTRTVLAHVTQAALAHSQLPRSRLSPRVNTQPRANSWAERISSASPHPRKARQLLLLLKHSPHPSGCRQAIFHPQSLTLPADLKTQSLRLLPSPEGSTTPATQQEG